MAQQQLQQKAGFITKYIDEQIHSSDEEKEIEKLEFAKFDSFRSCFGDTGLIRQRRKKETY